jgi:hypothetical protein
VFSDSFVHPFSTKYLRARESDFLASDLQKSLLFLRLVPA